MFCGRISFGIFDIFKFNNLSEDEIKCAGIIGVSENFITKKRFQSTKTVIKIISSRVRGIYLF